MAEDALVKKEETSLQKLAQTLFKSRMFPNVGNEYAAVLVVQYGSELGVPPATALQTISVIKGKMAIAGQMLLSLAKKKGVGYTIIKESETESEISFVRSGHSPDKYVARFTLAEAKAANLVKPDSGWEKYPKDMLFWRAVARGLRRIAPDITMGIYAKEELEDGIIIEAETTQTTTTKALPEPSAGTSETQGSTTGTPVPSEEEPKPEEQRGKRKELTQEEMVDAFYSIMAEQCKRIGVEKYEAWLKGNSLESLEGVTARENMKELYLSIKAIK